MRHYYERIRLVLEWIPVIWGNYYSQWDYSGMFNIWAFSLKKLEYGVENGMAVDGPKTAKSIKTARLLLERLVNDNYTTADYARVAAKYPERQAKLGEDGFYRRPPMSEDEAKEIRALGDREVELRSQDMDLFCKTLKTKYQEWWD